MPKNPRHVKLLANEDVQAWYANMANGNEGTAKSQLRSLGLFCERMETPLDVVLSMESKPVANLLVAYAVKYRLANTPTVVKAVKSLVAWKGTKVEQPIKYRRDKSPKRQHVPSQEVLRGVLNVASVRARAAIGLVAFSEQRLEVLGRGSDGLRLDDIPDLKITQLLSSHMTTKLRRAERTKSQYGHPSSVVEPRGFGPWGRRAHFHATRRRELSRPSIAQA